MGNVFKALADPTRRHILQLLKARPMTAGEIAEHFATSKPTSRPISPCCAKRG
jgi:DNA-binding transcriptional ArsR family regulator